ncbi:MAG TPA: hypothetical protein VFP91_00875 [Vicinamibacterales bacterium]|nr:hypothetical protein [Vicinamibacterales bacterium]
MAGAVNELIENEWVTLPGGELEGRRPKTLCGPCRVRQAAGASPRAICFECYRADRRRDEAIKAASEFEAASEARFQDGLPFEPVNISRLERLKAERIAVRRHARVGVGRFVDKRRHAQIAARHALRQIAMGLMARPSDPVARASAQREELEAIHAAELQLPDTWLPFVVAR